MWSDGTDIWVNAWRYLWKYNIGTGLKTGACDVGLPTDYEDPPIEIKGFDFSSSNRLYLLRTYTRQHFMPTQYLDYWQRSFVKSYTLA